MKKAFILLLLLIGALQYGKAQTTQLRFDHFTEKEGLPDPQIAFIKQDDQGYIWIGTVTSLVRYDGYNLKRYISGTVVTTMITGANHDLWFGSVGKGFARYNRESDNFTVYQYPAPDNKDTYYQYLATMDGEGNIWGYRYGSSHNLSQIIKFDTSTKRYAFFSTPNSFSSLEGHPPAIYSSGKSGSPVWIGDDSGLFQYSYGDKTFHPFPSWAGTVGQKPIYRIFSTPAEPGILWINTVDHSSKGRVIERLDTRSKTVKYFSHTSNPELTASNDTINDLYEDSKHRIWLATNNGLMRYNTAGETFTLFVPADTGKNDIQKIAEAKDGSLWLTTTPPVRILTNKVGKGLLNFDPEKQVFKHYGSSPDDPAGLSSNEMIRLLVDKTGVLWAGSTQYGIDKLNPATSIFQNYPITVRDGTAFTPGDTNNITVTADGACWFTNDQGIFKWKPGSGQPEEVYKKKRSDNGLDAMLVSRDDKLYFGNGNGLQIYDPVKRTTQSYSCQKDDSITISANKIDIMREDHLGLIWIGTVNGGVCSFDPLTRKFRRYPFITNDETQASGDKLDDRIVDDIYEDREGTLWVATLSGGLNRFDRKTGKFKSYLTDGQLNVHTPTHLFEDKQGRFWVGTFTLGLFEFDRKAGHYIRHFTEDNGLLFNTVNEIIQDKDGFLLVSSPRGLTRLDPVTLTMKTFPLTKILPGKSLLIDWNMVQTGGQLLLILNNGIAAFDPAELNGNPYPPVVHIEKVGHSNPAAAADSITTKLAFGVHQLELPYDQNRITFNYVALHYADPSRNIYAYRLTGYDQHWIQTGTQRSVTYTNLSPGTYTFHAKAASSDGVWDNKGDSFIIVINPPWWQTWWAWVLWIVLFFSAVYTFVAYRSRKLQRDNRVLEHKVHIRTEEVMQQKEEIEAQRDNLEQALDELKNTQAQLVQREKMASLGELTAGIAHEIQNPLNFVNNFSDVNREMLEELKAETKKQKAERDEQLETELINDLIDNEQKINHHGKRADSIVKGMLEHSRASTGQKEPTDLNTLADEYLRLAYHGLRAKDKDFNTELITSFDEELPKADIVPQDIGRVMLNMFNNAFYAINEKAKISGQGYKPTVEVSTAQQNGSIIISVKDNGTGIPENIREKIMQPFFTTKPTGEGTGLGLSLSYDIVVKGHGGKIDVNSKEGEGSEFVIAVPLG
ncbi:MAG TPA: two-component regulator propeller domain-containing protein [Mucilaginibacter sp.]|jgi:signal transduction histidine kinase/ligand-binding sensor domain-containing protein|nr:two-component regulator propeller domain-containing protein [Mucilaginibacter sp.]